MRIVTLLVILVGLAAAGAGCPKKPAPPASKGNSAAPMKNPSPGRPMGIDQTGRWDCKKDADCLNSCSQGAVSRSWYRAHQKEIPECLDGCNNQISGPPRCLQGGCVAFDWKGKRRNHCTRKRPRR